MSELAQVYHICSYSEFLMLALIKMALILLLPMAFATSRYIYKKNNVETRLFISTAVKKDYVQSGELLPI